MRALMVAASMAAFVVSACALLPAPTQTGGPERPAPEAVANRLPLPLCGVERSGQEGPWNEQARACFWKAYLEHRPAEFISTRPTTEGDPITTIYRVLPDGSVELFIDSTQDTFGSGAWERLACRTLAHLAGSGIVNDFSPDETCIAVPLS